MRELIISNIIQFMALMLKRGVTINMKCATKKKKKIPFIPSADNKQEASKSDHHQFDGEFSDVQYNYSDLINHQQDSVEEVEQILTNEEVSISVVISLIHVRNNFINLCRITNYSKSLIINKLNNNNQWPT